MDKRHLKLSTNVGEKFEMYWSQTGQNHLKLLSTMVRVFFTIMAKNHCKLSIMVGEDFAT